MTYLVKSAVALACLAASLSTHSSYAAPEKDEIIVTAKGQQTISNALHTTYVFDLEDIEAAQVKDIPALLNRLTGISISESGGRGSATSVFVRGVSSSQTIVLIDGVRVGSATLGAAALNSYPIEAIERIEVLKGPFSGIYGADAVGGVIQLFTKKGGDSLGVVSASLGSNSLTEFDLGFNGGNDRASFHIAAHSEDTDGIDRTSILTDGNDDIDGFEETAVSLGGQVKFGDSTLAKLSILGTDSTVEFDNTFGPDAGLMTESKTLSSALTINTVFSESWNWSTTLGINEDESVTNGAFPSEFITNRDSLGNEFAWTLSENSTLTFGADYYEEDIESSNDFPVTERDNTGVFIQLQSLGDTFGMVASLRSDDNSAYGSNTNGSLALSYNVSEDFRVVASYGTAFVAPSFNFLYFPFFGNPDILPEKSESAELSLVGNYDNIDWRVSAYRNNIDNLFSFDPDTFLAANVGEATIDGIEAELKTSLADWDLSVNADVLSATNDLTGVELNDRAERTLSVSAARNFGALDLSFDLKAENQRYDNNGTELSGYGLFDISASYKINDAIKVSANVDNVFDKDYTLNLIGASERYNTEGRQAKLTVRYAF